MKNTVTISVSVPIDVAKQLDVIAADTNVSRSAVATAILSLAFKWGLLKGVVKNGL